MSYLMQQMLLGYGFLHSPSIVFFPVIIPGRLSADKKQHVSYVHGGEFSEEITHRIATVASLNVSPFTC